jgi:type II secretory pathway predicted ATPase ExeA
MYESFYGLSRRPFAATPDPACWYRSGRYQAAIDELLICAEQGQGIGILVAPAGSGKTLICERLIREIGEPFTSVLLRHATYNTRRAFLQTLLSELAQPYVKHSDQELRLVLAPVLKGLHQQGRALLLVVDEAQQLSESLLEELRILADQAEDGQPIVRLILAGQFGLEEKLAHPALQSLNQRVRAHVALEPLSLAESADYIDFRITWGGGRTASIFAPDALAAIARAADGLPRCLNQLCDHALLLGYVNEQRPVTAETIAAALEDLRHLPLPWNLSGAMPAMTAPVESRPAVSETIEWGTDTLEEAPPAVAELNPVLEPAFSAEDADEFFADEEDDFAPVEPPVAELPVVELSVVTPPRVELPHASPPPPVTFGQDFVSEEFVYDRYNALDAGLEPSMVPASPVPVASHFAGLPFSVTTSLFATNITPIERLDAIQRALDAVDEPLIDLDEDMPETADIAADPVEIDSAPMIDEPAPESAVFEFGGDEPVATAAAAIVETVSAPPAESRDCRNLFTRLRRKQMGR